MHADANTDAIQCDMNCAVRVRFSAFEQLNTGREREIESESVLNAFSLEHLRQTIQRPHFSRNALHSFFHAAYSGRNMSDTMFSPFLLFLPTDYFDTI